LDSTEFTLEQLCVVLIDLTNENNVTVPTEDPLLQYATTA